MEPNLTESLQVRRLSATRTFPRADSVRFSLWLLQTPVLSPPVAFLGGVLPSGGWRSSTLNFKRWWNRTRMR